MCSWSSASRSEQSSDTSLMLEIFLQTFSPFPTLSITPLVNYSSMRIEDVHLLFEATEVISLEARLSLSVCQSNQYWYTLERSFFFHSVLKRQQTNLKRWSPCLKERVNSFSQLLNRCNGETTNIIHGTSLPFHRSLDVIECRKWTRGSFGDTRSGFFEASRPRWSSCFRWRYWLKSWWASERRVIFIADLFLFLRYLDERSLFVWLVQSRLVFLGRE